MDESGIWDDSGWWLDSGFWDESGVVYDVKGGYDYYIVEFPSTIPVFLVRLIMIWSPGNFNLLPAVQVYCGWDDGAVQNPFASGDVPDPVTYIDSRHYEVTNVRITEVRISSMEYAIGINVSYVIDYDYDSEDITIGNHVIHKKYYGDFQQTITE